MNFNILKKNSYLVLASFLIIFEFIQITKGQWVGDFFEHAAVVKELSQNLFHPKNPIIRSEIPHAFFSPYAVVVAAFSKFTGLSSIHALTCFAFFNLIFFLYCLYFFSKSIFQKKHGLIASLSLIFTMLFWGESPFIWSGFYHIFGLHYILPYPSTFALALSLLTLGLVSKNNSKYYPIIIFCNAVVLITHPTTAVILFTAIVAMCFCFKGYSLKQYIVNTTTLTLPSVVLSMFWPYFNIFDLLIGNNSALDFNTSSVVVYSDIFKKNWPILLAVPSLIYSKYHSKAVFLALSVAMLVLFYLAGYIFNFYGISRVISGAILFSHILIAYTVVLLLDKPKIVHRYYLSFLLLSFVISISLNFSQLGRVVAKIFKEKDIEYYHKFSFLKSEVNSTDIILSDNRSNWYIPSYNGKVISSSCADECKHPLHWIDDYKDRRNAIDSFFMKESSDSLKLILIKTYNPDYILINYSNIDISDSTYKWIKRLGQITYKKNNFELLKLYKK